MKFVAFPCLFALFLTFKNIQNYIKNKIFYIFSNPIKFLKLSGIVLFIAGATLASFSTKMSSAWYPYFMFLVGHLIWSSIGIKMKDTSIFWLSAIYLPMDAYAIFVRI